MWTGTGMEARPTSSNVLAFRMSRNGETLGSEETMDDRMTPAETKRLEMERKNYPSIRFYDFLSPSSSSSAPGEATNTGSDG